MKRFIVLLLAILSIGFLFSGCSSGTEDVVFSCDDFNKQQNLDANVTVDSGETVTVKLCSNASTGFSWDENAKIADTGILKQTGQQVISPEKDMPGAAGQQEWTFTALKSGTTTAYLEYGRPWEGGEKGVWTFTLTVTVK
ncbi:MAG: protease inhibitor I42 family protein [Dehalococcoidia bacterium]